MNALFRNFVRGSEGAGTDPSGDERDLLFAQCRFLVRHAREAVVRPLEDLNQQALRAPSGLDDRAVLAALEREGSRVQTHAALLLRCAVAAITVLGEDGLDVAQVIGRRAGCGRNEAEEDGEIEQGQLHLRCLGWSVKHRAFSCQSGFGAQH